MNVVNGVHMPKKFKVEKKISREEVGDIFKLNDDGYTAFDHGKIQKAMAAWLENFKGAQENVYKILEPQNLLLLERYCDYLSKRYQMTGGVAAPDVHINLFWPLVTALSQFPSIASKFAALLNINDNVIEELAQNAQYIYGLSVKTSELGGLTGGVPREQRLGVLLQVIGKTYSEKARTIILKNLLLSFKNDYPDNAQNWSNIVKDALQHVGSRYSNDAAEKTAISEFATGFKEATFVQTPPSTPTKSSDSGDDSTEIASMESDPGIRQYCKELMGKINPQTQYYIDYCQQLTKAAKHEEPKYEDLLALVVALTRNTDESLQTAFEGILTKPKVVQKLIEEPELLYWLSRQRDDSYVNQGWTAFKQSFGYDAISSTERITVSKDARVRKVLEAINKNQNLITVNGSASALAEKLVGDPKRDIYTKVIRAALKEYGHIGTKNQRVFGTKIDFAENFVRALDTELQNTHGFNPHHGIYSTAARLGRAVARTAVNTVTDKTNEFESGQARFAELTTQSTANDYKTVATKLASAFSDNADAVNERRSVFLKYLRNQDKEISQAHLSTLAAVLLSSEDKTFWDTVSCFSQDSRSLLSLEERIKLVEILLNHLRTDTNLSPNIQARAMQFIQEQVIACRQTEQKNAILPVLFRKENFDFLISKKETYSDNVKTIFDVCFSAELHDALYAASRRGDWDSVTEIVKAEKWLAITVKPDPKLNEEATEQQRTRETQYKTTFNDKESGGAWAAASGYVDSAFPQGKGTFANWRKALGIYFGGELPKPAVKEQWIGDSVLLDSALALRVLEDKREARYNETLGAKGAWAAAKEYVDSAFSQGKGTWANWGKAMSIYWKGGVLKSSYQKSDTVVIKLEAATTTLHQDSGSTEEITHDLHGRNYVFVPSADVVYAQTEASGDVEKFQDLKTKPAELKQFVQQLFESKKLVDLYLALTSKEDKKSIIAQLINKQRTDFGQQAIGSISSGDQKAFATEYGRLVNLVANREKRAEIAERYHTNNSSSAVIHNNSAK